MSRYWNGYRWVDDPPMARAKAGEPAKPVAQDEVDPTPEQSIPNSVTPPRSLPEPDEETFDPFEDEDS